MQIQFPERTVSHGMSQKALNVLSLFEGSTKRYILPFLPPSPLFLSSSCSMWSCLGSSAKFGYLKLQGVGLANLSYNSLKLLG